MRRLRAILSLSLGLLLLAQGALASAAPLAIHATPPAATGDMPCHGSAAPKTDTPSCCIDGDCQCAPLCSGGTALPSVAVAHSAAPAGAPAPAVAVPPLAAAHTLTPLRPPIAS